jgi:hypothetical protein
MDGRLGLEVSRRIDRLNKHVYTLFFTYLYMVRGSAQVWTPCPTRTISLCPCVNEQKLVQKSIFFSSKTWSAERTEDLQETAWFKSRTENSEFFDAVKIVNGPAVPRVAGQLWSPAPSRISPVCVSSATTAPQQRERTRAKARGAGAAGAARDRVVLEEG